MVIAYDPFSDEAMADATHLYKAMREEGRPHFVEKYNAWALTRFEEVKAASLKEKNLDFTSGQTPGQLMLHEPAIESFATKNGQEHRKWRGLIAGDFTVEAVAAQKPRYRELARGLWDKLKHNQEVDVYKDLANRFFCINSGYKLGLPAEEAEHYRALIDDLLHREPGQVGAVSERNQKAFGELAQLLGGYVQKLRQDPSLASGYTKIYMEAEIGGKRLSDHELLMYLITLLILGSETTPMVIAALFYHLDKNPDQKRRVLADHSLIRRAFAEAGRFRQPTNMLARRVAADFVLGGEEIKAGQNLLFVYASANRDAQRFKDPDKFDIFREDAEPNLTFGIGAHMCLGKHVATEAAVIIVEEILKDIEDYSIIDERVVLAYGEHLAGFIGMPIRFTLKK